MKSILLSLLVVVALASCQSKKPDGGFSVKGKIDGADGKTYVLAKVENRQLAGIDTAAVENGAVEFYGKLDFPQQLYVVELGQQRPVMMFFGENGDMTFEGNVDSLAVAEVQGSKANDVFNEYNKSMEKYNKQNQDLMIKYQKAQATKDQKAIEEVYAEYDDMMAKKNEDAKKIIKENPKSPVSLYLIQSDFMMSGYKDLNEVFSALDPSLASLPGYKEIKDYLDIMAKVQEGKPAPDFTVPTIDGKEVSLSSLKGKYVLLDFWASWCKPCIGEIPFMQQAYKNYKRKGFEIFSVSVDRDEAAWKKAVADHKMTWLQGHDTQDISHSKYGVMSIPTTLLLDKDGVIIAKNLRGEALAAKLKELMN
jgi:peroxiredoxin